MGSRQLLHRDAYMCDMSVCECMCVYMPCKLESVFHDELSAHIFIKVLYAEHFHNRMAFRFKYIQTPAPYTNLNVKYSL